MAGHEAALALAQLERQGLVFGSDTLRVMTLFQSY